VLRCAHMYCSSCSSRMFGHNEQPRRSSACPMCRLPLSSKMDIVNVKEFVHARAQERKCKITKHGSKLQHVAEVLRTILNRPGEERAIVFCQFDDLEMQVSQALSEFGITHARLSTACDIFERTAVLDDFQHRRGGRRVLLLSLEQSASGTNLTVANNVLLVHPMVASTPERAVAFEQQAVGRCVRLGQRRTVFVWRFVTKGTVEEVLHGRLAARRQTGKGVFKKSVSAVDVKTSRPEPAGSGSEAVQALRTTAIAQSGQRTAGRRSRTSRSPSTRVSTRRGQSTGQSRRSSEAAT